MGKIDQLSFRAKTVIKKANLASEDDLYSMGDDELLKIEGCGSKTLLEIRKVFPNRPPDPSFNLDYRNPFQIAEHLSERMTAEEIAILIIFLISYIINVSYIMPYLLKAYRNNEKTK